jgi:hypothetical protein
VDNALLGPQPVEVLATIACRHGGGPALGTSRKIGRD